MPPPLPEKPSQNQKRLHMYLRALELVMDKTQYDNLTIWAADQTFYGKVYKAFLEDSPIWPRNNLLSRRNNHT